MQYNYRRQRKPMLNFFIILILIIMSISYIGYLQQKKQMEQRKVIPFERVTPEPMDHKLMSRGETIRDLREYHNVPLTEAQQRLVQDLCKQYNIPGVTPTLIYAMMKVESNYNPNEISSTDDIGILQINQKYFDAYTKFNPNMYKLFNVDPRYRTNFTVQVITSLNALDYWNIYSKGVIKETLNGYNRGFKAFKDNNDVYANKVFKAQKEIEVK